MRTWPRTSHATAATPTRDGRRGPVDPFAVPVDPFAGPAGPGRRGRVADRPQGPLVREAGGPRARPVRHARAQQPAGQPQQGGTAGEARAGGRHTKAAVASRSRTSATRDADGWDRQAVAHTSSVPPSGPTTVRLSWYVPPTARQDVYGCSTVTAVA